MKAIKQRKTEREAFSVCIVTLHTQTRNNETQTILDGHISVQQKCLP